MERRELIRFLMATAGLKCLEGFRPDELLAFGVHVHGGPATGTQSAGVLDAHARRTVVIAAGVDALLLEAQSSALDDPASPVLASRPRAVVTEH